MRQLAGQARLSGSAGAGECHQAPLRKRRAGRGSVTRSRGNPGNARRARDKTAEPLDFCFTPHEASEFLRQITWMVGRRLRLRELSLGHVRIVDLVETPGACDVPEAK